MGCGCGPRLGEKRVQSLKTRKSEPVSWDFHEKIPLVILVRAALPPRVPQTQSWGHFLEKSIFRVIGSSMGNGEFFWGSQLGFGILVYGVGTPTTSRLCDSEMSHKKCDLGALRPNPSSRGLWWGRMHTSSLLMVLISMDASSLVECVTLKWGRKSVTTSAFRPRTGMLPPW